jgi:hypothetical protein
MKKYQRIEPLLQEAWAKAVPAKDNHAMSNLKLIALARPRVPQHMKHWLSEYVTQ